VLFRSLKDNHLHQQLAVNSGHWPLFRFNPQHAAEGKNPLKLDSKAPSIPYREFIETEIRFNMLWRTNPEQAEKFLEQSQQEVNERYRYYEQLAGLEWGEAEEVESLVTTQVEASANITSANTTADSTQEKTS